MHLIQTTKGKVELSNIDMICPHEHLFIDMTHEAIVPETAQLVAIFEGQVSIEKLGLLRRNPYVVKSNLILEDIESAVSEMQPLIELGCGLIVDVTSIGLGRNVHRVNELSDRTGIPVSVGCGFFTHDSVPDKYKCWDANRIADFMLNEIENGVDQTGVLPGVIGEIGVSEEINPFELQSLKGAAITQMASGLPLYLHTYPWSHSGLEATRLLIDLGVPPNQICVCHLDVSFDHDYIREFLNMGVYVEFDNFGKEFFFPPQNGAFAGGPFETDRARVSMLIELVKEGYINQLLLANDICLKSMLCAFGGWGYAHVHTNIKIMLEAENVSSNNIDLLLTINPRSFLGCK